MFTTHSRAACTRASCRVRRAASFGPTAISLPGALGTHSCRTELTAILPGLSQLKYPPFTEALNLHLTTHWQIRPSMDIWFEGSRNGRGVARLLKTEIPRISDPERRTLQTRFTAQNIAAYDIDINVLHRAQVAESCGRRPLHFACGNSGRMTLTGTASVRAGVEKLPLWFALLSLAVSSGRRSSSRRVQGCQG